MATVATLIGENILATAEEIRATRVDAVIQNSRGFGLIHTDRRHAQVGGTILLSWLNATRAQVDQVLSLYLQRAAAVFPWRRTPNDDGVRVQFASAPHYVWNRGVQTARLEVRLKPVRGISQTRIDTLFS